MNVLGFWLLALAIYALVALIGWRRLIPIVGQLLVAAIAIPAGRDHAERTAREAGPNVPSQPQ